MELHAESAVMVVGIAFENKGQVVALRHQGFVVADVVPSLKKILIARFHWKDQVRKHSMQVLDAKKALNGLWVPHPCRHPPNSSMAAIP